MSLLSPSGPVEPTASVNGEHCFCATRKHWDEMDGGEGGRDYFILPIYVPFMNSMHGCNNEL